MERCPPLICPRFQSEHLLGCAIKQVPNLPRAWPAFLSKSACSAPGLGEETLPTRGRGPREQKDLALQGQRGAARSLGTGRHIEEGPDHGT